MGEYIEAGDGQQAMEKASELVSQRVRITKGTLEDAQYDKEFTYVESILNILPFQEIFLCY